MQEVKFNSLRVRALQDFKVISTYSSTKFGSVSFVLHIPTRQYMILKYRISSELKPTEASKESAIYIRLGPHPHVCRFLGYCLIDKRMIMALQYYPLGDLKTQIERHRRHGVLFYPQHAWYLLLHITRALMHVHSKGVIFADLKPANVLLSEEIYSNTYGCEIRYIDDDMFVRDCNCNFVLCDFGHALDTNSPQQQECKHAMPPHSRFQYSQSNDKVNDIMALKRVAGSVNEISDARYQIAPSELLSSSPRRKFSTTEVINYEITRCGTFAYQSAEQRACQKLSGKTDVYSLALVAIEMLTLRKRSELNDNEFARIDGELRDYLWRMMGPENARPTPEDVYQKAINVLYCQGLLVQDALKNTSELLYERMLEMQKTLAADKSAYVRPPSGRRSNSRPVSASTNFRKSRPASYADTISSIIEEQTREVDVVGKQAVPSPVVEKLLRTSRFLDKWNKAHWDWDVEATNVIDPKQNYCTDSVIAEFGLSKQMERFEIQKNRVRNLDQLREGKADECAETGRLKSAPGSPYRHRQLDYVSTKGGGAVVKSTWRPDLDSGAYQFLRRCGSPQYRTVFQKQY